MWPRPYSIIKAEINDRLSNKNIIVRIDFEINLNNIKEDVIKSDVVDDGNNSNNNDVSVSEDSNNDS